MAFFARPETGCGGFFFEADADVPPFRTGWAGFFGLDFFFGLGFGFGLAFALAFVFALGLAFAFAFDFAGLRLDLDLDADLRDEEERELFFRAAFPRVEVFFFAFLLLAIRLNTDSR